jgi:hypothetical protein
MSAHPAHQAVTTRRDRQLRWHVQLLGAAVAVAALPTARRAAAVAYRERSG